MSPAFRYGVTLSFVLFMLCFRQTAVAQDDRISRVVLEIQDFSEQKTIPMLVPVLAHQKGLTLQTYCPDQDLVIVQYDRSLFADETQVASFLENNGLVVYVKVGITPDAALKQCVNGWVKLTPLYRD